MIPIAVDPVKVSICDTVQPSCFYSKMCLNELPTLLYIKFGFGEIHAVINLATRNIHMWLI